MSVFLLQEYFRKEMGLLLSYNPFILLMLMNSLEADRNGILTVAPEVIYFRVLTTVSVTIVLFFNFTIFTTFNFYKQCWPCIFQCEKKWKKLHIRPNYCC